MGIKMSSDELVMNTVAAAILLGQRTTRSHATANLTIMALSCTL